LKTNKLLSKNLHQANAANNNSIIPNHIKSKLKTIAKKIHHSVKFHQEESIISKNCQKCCILTGDSECLLDFTSYQTSGSLIEDKFKIEERHQYLILPAEKKFAF
jgi:hypothetical protein